MNNSMINPSIVDLMDQIDNKYALVVLASRRARQIIEGAESLVDIESTKPVTIAINEIDQEKISYKIVEEGIE